jgi:hypothetical protein
VSVRSIQSEYARNHENTKSDFDFFSWFRVSVPVFLRSSGSRYREALCARCPRVIALKAIVSTQHATMVMNTPVQPQ